MGVAPLTITLTDPPVIFFFFLGFATLGSTSTEVSVPDGGMLPPGVTAMFH